MRAILFWRPHSGSRFVGAVLWFTFLVALSFAWYGYNASSTYNVQQPEERIRKVYADDIPEAGGIIADGNIPVITRKCTQKERVDHMQKSCANIYEVNKKNLKTPAGRSLVDYNHKLLFCWMSKAGCTSLKAFIVESNGWKPHGNISKENALNPVHFAETLNPYGIKQIHQLVEKEQDKVINEFYKVFAIRHPFDRLVAYYRDKLVDSDRGSAHPKRKKEILRFARPEVFENNKTLLNSETPQDYLGPPTFLEFLKWSFANKQMDEHWSYIYETCHTCAHSWDAILRIETMDSDSEILIDKLNASTSSIPVRHSHEEQRNYSAFVKPLSSFDNVPDDLIDYLLEFYRVDMEMYGYRWHKESRTAYCAIPVEDGFCC